MNCSLLWEDIPEYQVILISTRQEGPDWNLESHILGGPGSVESFVHLWIKSRWMQWKTWSKREDNYVHARIRQPTLFITKSSKISKEMITLSCKIIQRKYQLHTFFFKFIILESRYKPGFLFLVGSWLILTQQSKRIIVVLHVNNLEDWIHP